MKLALAVHASLTPPRTRMVTFAPGVTPVTRIAIGSSISESSWTISNCATPGSADGRDGAAAAKAKRKRKTLRIGQIVRALGARWLSRYAWNEASLRLE